MSPPAETVEVDADVAEAGDRIAESTGVRLTGQTPPLTSKVPCLDAMARSRQVGVYVNADCQLVVRPPCAGGAAVFDRDQAAQLRNALTAQIARMDALVHLAATPGEANLPIADIIADEHGPDGSGRPLCRATPTN